MRGVPVGVPVGVLLGVGDGVFEGLGFDSFAFANVTVPPVTTPASLSGKIISIFLISDVSAETLRFWTVVTSSSSTSILYTRLS